MIYHPRDKTQGLSHLRFITKKESKCIMVRCRECNRLIDVIEDDESKTYYDICKHCAGDGDDFEINLKEILKGE